MASASAAVSVSCQALRGIIEAVPVALVGSNERGHVVVNNQEFRRLLGYSEEELREASVTTLLPLGLRAYEQFWSDSQGALEQSDIELRIRRRDGREAWVRLSIKAIRVDGARCALATVRELAVPSQAPDVLQMQAASEALRESEDKFATAFRVSPGIMSISDFETGRYIEVNEAHERVFGFTRAESIGRSPTELGMLPEPAVRQGMLALLERYGRIRDYRVDACSRDGKPVIVLLSAEVIQLGGRKCVLRNSQDITALVVAEQEKEKLEAQLRQSQKLEALGTLASGIAHDFNNILGAISAYRELAEMDIEQPSELREHLNEIALAGRRAKDLVAQILAFGRQQRKERHGIQLHWVVKEALKLLRASLPASIDIAANIDAHAPSVLADPSQIHQVMMNLCTNAAQAMGAGPGRLTVTLDQLSLSDVEARRDARLPHRSCVRLSVSDTGSGMDEATRARIFEPFFSTKPAGEGTGLGLSVVHGIMQEHDGVILLDSELGHGTTFELFFPEYAGTAPAIWEVPENVPRGAGESVLLIEDERALCNALSAGLERLGYRVSAFTSPIEALSRFLASPQRFDLLITDHGMPELSGLDVAARVRRVRPRMPALLLTGLNAALVAEALHDLSITELLTKPIDLSALAQAVRRALAAA